MLFSFMVFFDKVIADRGQYFYFIFHNEDFHNAK